MNTKNVKILVFLICGAIIMFCFIVFSKKEHYSPSIDNIIEEYIQENSRCSDSTFYVTIEFFRNRDSLRVHVTGCQFALVSSPRYFKSEQEAYEAIRNGEDMYNPMYGYYRKEKNQWVFIYYTDTQDLPIIRDMFINKPWRHDKEYENWCDVDDVYETDLWFYKIEGHNLILRRKDVFR